MIVSETPLLVGDGDEQRVVNVNAHILDSFAVLVLALALHDLPLLGRGEGDS